MPAFLEGIPSSRLEQAETLEAILLAYATGEPEDERAYAQLRRKFIDDGELRDLLPSFVKTYRSLEAFWPFIKRTSASYAGRREFISKAFTPLIDYLEGRNGAPSDKVASNVLESFDAESVHAAWNKALARRNSDPEGAITSARTLLEAVSKRILDECGEAYSDSDDLPKLYNKAAKALNLAPSQHTEDAFKSILGGAMTVVNGIGTVRNRLSDAHGRGGKSPVRPAPRHASLAVNMAGAMATFLVETFQEQSE
ncbi:abortive infection family protein [Rhodovulum sp. DZ06]|uniref:abortive infection family protein n=1 Tax=Rhodovulum sp. DZ06 TaxID=3425126 RepID=UPI003D34428E